MNSKERVFAAINHKVPDRVPITFDAAPEVYSALYKHFGLSSREALFNRVHCDTWMILPGNFVYTKDEENKVEKTTVWGHRTIAKNYPGGTYDEVCHNPLAGKDEISDLKKYKWPSPEIFDFSHFVNEAKLHSDRAVIGVFTWGPYFIALFLRGLENLMLDFAIRKDYVKYMINTLNEISFSALSRMLESHGEGIDIIYMADDYCSQDGPLFSPEDFRELIFPYLRRLVDLTHRHNKKFLLHVCGAVRPLLPMIIEAGVDMLEPLQITAAGMEPAGLKKDFGNDICFYGGVDLQQILCKGSPRQVADEVKRLIDILNVNGGYILGPGHTYIQIDTPLENIFAMYETAFVYRNQQNYTESAF
jgi:uroporphyrinogen decarboxylase